MKRKVLVCMVMLSLVALTPPPAASQPSWTVMVYMDGDNNLEGAALDDMNEMEFSGSTLNVNIVVQVDRIPGYDSTNGDWTTTRRYYITNDPGGYNGTIVSTLISDLGEVNMGDPNSLAAFVNWARTAYPANYYLLVLWDHGDGWKKANNTVMKGALVKSEKREPEKGVCYDDTNSDYLNTPDIRTALNTITAGGTNPVDVVGVDACLMATVELGRELLPYAAYMVGSEENEPGDGWDYQTTLNWLAVNPASTPDQVASRIVTDYMNFYGLGGAETHSAVDLSQGSALVSAVDTFALDLIAVAPSYFYQIVNARTQVEEFGDPDFIDLYHFAQLIRAGVPDPQVQADAQNVMNAITAAVIAEGHGGSHPNVHGLSIYFPYGSDDYLSRYETETYLAIDTSWDEFLNTYYSTAPVPLHAIALIDDDNGRDLQDVEDYYTQALDALAVQYDYYDTDIYGSPSLFYLQAHAAVIWFTGSDFSTTLSPQDESNLTQYLLGGGKLFLSSQDYVWDLKMDVRYPSTFLRLYLHTLGEGEDTGISTLTGIGGNEVGDGLGPYDLCWVGGNCDFIDYADWVQKDAVSSYAFVNEGGEYVAITYSSGQEVVFFPFRFEGLYLAERITVMDRILSFLEPITAFGSLEPLFDTNSFFVAGDLAYCTDVLGSAKIGFAMGIAGTTENPEGRTDLILTSTEHATGNLILVGGPAINPLAVEFDPYFGITYNYQPTVSFEIFADSSSIFLDLTRYPTEDIAIVYLGEQNERNVLIVWGYGWQGTYAASLFIGDLAKWEQYRASHMLMIRWLDTNADGLVQESEITVEAST